MHSIASTYGCVSHGHACHEVHPIGIYLTGLNPTGMHLMSVHRIGMYPLGAYAISVDATGIYSKELPRHLMSIPTL